MASTNAPQPISLQNVLFVTDFSESSIAALPYAIAVALRYTGKVYLAHVVSPEMYEFVPPESLELVHEQIARYAEQRMQQLIADVRLRGVPHEGLVKQGEIWDALSGLADKHNIDLVVVGTRGRRGLKKLLMGSVAEEIIQLARCPVLTVGPQSGAIPPERELHTIIYATDFSTDLVRARALAISLVQEFGARLISVHVASQGSEDPQSRTRFEEYYTERLRELMPPTPRIQQEYRVEFGSAAEGILKAAAESKADLIVIGVHGSGSLARADDYRGSTAHRVVSLAPSPVLTVRG